MLELLETIRFGGEHIQDGIDLHDGLVREGKTEGSLLEHLADGLELPASQQLRRKKRTGELDGDLTDVPAPAVPLLPGMLQLVSRDQGQFIIPDLFHAVSDDTTHASTVLDEIELIFGMPVDGKQEFRLMPFHHVKTVLVGQRGDFMHDLAHGRLALALYKCKEKSILSCLFFRISVS